MLNFKFKYKKNEGVIMSPSELKALYLYGIPIQNQQGTEMPDHIIETYIKAAQEDLEEVLSIKISKQIIEESLSYHLTDFNNFGFIRNRVFFRSCD